MPNRCAALCLLLMPLAAPAAAPDDEAVKREEAKLAGTWGVVSIEVGGRPVPAREYRGLKLTFRKGGKYTAGHNAEDSQEGEYKLSPSKSPKQIDILRKEGPKEGRKQLAIYALAGNTLKICSAGSDSDRPENFDTRGKPGCTLMTLRREP